MDAKTFITRKNEAAVAELKALDDEFLPRMDSALAMVDLTKKWLEELGSELTEDEGPSLQEVAKTASQNWMVGRDANGRLLPK